MKIELNITGAEDSQIHAFLESLQNSGIKPEFIRSVILDTDDRNAAGLCGMRPGFLVHDSTDHRFVEPAQNHGREAKRDDVDGPMLCGQCGENLFEHGGHAFEFTTKRNNGPDEKAVCDECGRAFDPAPVPQTSIDMPGSGNHDHRCAICKGPTAAEQAIQTRGETGLISVCSNRCYAEHERRRAFVELTRRAE